MSQLLGVSGRKMVEIGGKKVWEQRVKGDICISYQYLMVGGKEAQACMVLHPVIPKLDGGAYAVPQENAYEYVDTKGNPTPYLHAAAFNSAVSMGFFPDKSTVWRIVDIIVDGLPDLIRMPSDAPNKDYDVEKMIRGIQATVKVNGQVMREELI